MYPLQILPSQHAAKLSPANPDTGGISSTTPNVTVARNPVVRRGESTGDVEAALPSGAQSSLITTRNAELRVTSPAAQSSAPLPQSALNVIASKLRNVSEKHKKEFEERLPDEADLREFVAKMEKAVESDDPKLWDAALAAYMKAQKLDAPDTQKRMWWGQFWSGVTLGKHYFYPLAPGLIASALLLLPHTDDRNVVLFRSGLEAGVALGAALIEPLLNSIAFIAYVPPSDRNMQTTADIFETLNTPMLQEANKTMTEAIKAATEALKRKGAGDVPDEVLEAARDAAKAAIAKMVQGRHEWQMRSKINTVYYGGYRYQSIPKGLQAYLNAASIGVGLKYGPQAAGIMQLTAAAGVMLAFLPLSGLDKTALESNMQPLNMLDAYKKIDLGPAPGEKGHDPDTVQKGREKYAKRIRTELDVRQAQARQRLWIDMRKYAMMSANLLNGWLALLKIKHVPIQPDEWIRYTNLSERIGHLQPLTYAERTEYQELDWSVSNAKAELAGQRDPGNKNELSPQEKELAKLERIWAQTEIDPEDVESGANKTAEAAAKLLKMRPEEWQRWATLKDRADLPGLKDRIESAMKGLSGDKREKLKEWGEAWLETRRDLDHIEKKDYGEVSDRNKPMVNRLMDIAEYGSPVWRMVKNVSSLIWPEERHAAKHVGLGRVGLPEEIIAPIALSYWYFFHFIVGGPVFPLAVGAGMGVIDNWRRRDAGKIESVAEREQQLATIDRHAHIERYALIAFIALVQMAGFLASRALSKTQVGKKNTWADTFNTYLGTNSEHQIGSLTAFFLFCRAQSRADQALGKFQKIRWQGWLTSEFLRETRKIVASGLFLLGQEGWAGHQGKKLVSEVSELLPQLRDMVEKMEEELKRRQASEAPPDEHETAAAQEQIESVRSLIPDVQAAIEASELAEKFENDPELQGNPREEALEAAMSTPLPGASDGLETVGDLLNVHMTVQQGTNDVLREAVEQAEQETRRALQDLEESGAKGGGEASRS